MQVGKVARIAVDTMRVILSLHGFGQPIRTVHICSTLTPTCSVLAAGTGADPVGIHLGCHLGRDPARSQKAALLLALAKQQMRLGLNHSDVQVGTHASPGLSAALFKTKAGRQCITGPSHANANASTGFVMYMFQDHPCQFTVLTA
jgi:hypothetical protein